MICSLILSKTRRDIIYLDINSLRIYHYFAITFICFLFLNGGIRTLLKSFNPIGLISI